jgi:hypothetical protein
LIEDEGLRDSYGLAGKKRVREYFSSKNMVVAHEQLYQDLLK